MSDAEFEVRLLALEQKVEQLLRLIRAAEERNNANQQLARVLTAKP